MQAKQEVSPLKCGACQSTEIGCIGLESVSYAHIAEIAYECVSCGHKGEISVDCTKPQGLKLLIS